MQMMKKMVLSFSDVTQNNLDNDAMLALKLQQEEQDKVDF
jgi:hypothetical protein